MASAYQIKKAKKRVKAKKGFYWHFASYVIVISFLSAINILTNDHELWVIYPALGWGVSILFHYIGVFGIPGLGDFSKEWEEKEIEKELRKLGAEEAEYLDLRKPEKTNDEIDIDERLKLKEMRKNYDDSEFV